MPSKFPLKGFVEPLHFFRGRNRWNAGRALPACWQWRFPPVCLRLPYLHRDWDGELGQLQFARRRIEQLCSGQAGSPCRHPANKANRYFLIFMCILSFYSTSMPSGRKSDTSLPYCRSSRTMVELMEAVRARKEQDGFYAGQLAVDVGNGFFVFKVVYGTDAADNESGLRSRAKSTVRLSYASTLMRGSSA